MFPNVTYYKKVLLYYIHALSLYTYLPIDTNINRPQRAPVKRLTAPQQKLPNKPTDFQVRIHVLEARKLVGSGLNPAVKVACGKETQQTRTQKGTRNPVFDEVSALLQVSL